MGFRSSLAWIDRVDRLTELFSYAAASLVNMVEGEVSASTKLTERKKVAVALDALSKYAHDLTFELAPAEATDLDRAFESTLQFLEDSVVRLMNGNYHERKLGAQLATVLAHLTQGEEG